MSVTRLVIVPVRAGSGAAALQCGRLPTGERVGIAFSTADRLAGAMGPGQPGMWLDVRAMRGMLAPAGVTLIQVDPGAVVSAGRPLAASA
jgi:hypothetical protein